MSYCPPSVSNRLSNVMKRDIRLWRNAPIRRQLVIRAIQLFETEILRSEREALAHLDRQIGLI